MTATAEPMSITSRFQGSSGRGVASAQVPVAVEVGGAVLAREFADGQQHADLFRD